MKYYLIIFLLSILPVVSLFFTPEIPHTHDGAAHLPRIGAYFKALTDGQIPVRWAGDLNYGYGMPIFNFMYPLPYFLSSALILLGFSLADSFESVLLASYILSGVFMYAFAIAFFKDEKKAFLVAVLYQLAPFRLIEIFVRGSFGEVYIYTFLPLILLGVVRLFQKQTYGRFLLSAIATFFLVISHNGLSFVYFGIAALFILFFAINKRQMYFAFASLGVGLLLASFYWIPAILEHQYTNGDTYMREMYRTHFPSFYYFVIPNITNMERFLVGGIAVFLGLVHVPALAYSIFLFFRKKIDSKEKRLFIFCFILTGAALFLMQPISNFLWENVTQLRQFQFPWRFLAVTVFSTSLLSVSLFHLPFFKKPLIYTSVIFIAILGVVYYFKPPLGLDNVNENKQWNYPLNTTYFGETDLIWSKGQADGFPKTPVEPKSGTAYISNYRKKSNLHTYTVDAKNDSALVDHTQYFPGWKVFVDEKQVPIEFQDLNWRGEITFPVSKGKHSVKVVFGESPIRLFADVLTVVSFLFLGIIFFLKEKLKKLSVIKRIV